MAGYEGELKVGLSLLDGSEDYKDPATRLTIVAIDGDTITYRGAGRFDRGEQRATEADFRAMVHEHGLPIPPPPAAPPPQPNASPVTPTAEARATCVLAATRLSQDPEDVIRIATRFWTAIEGPGEDGAS